MSRSKKLIVTALFLIGACILLYPAVSNKLAERHQAEMISRYEQTVEELPKTDMKSEWEKAVKYNESVTGMSVEDPFILGSGSVLPGNYKDVLNVEEKEGVTLVQDRLRSVVLLQADVTLNSTDDRALLQRFQLFGPPGIVFFDANGQEVAGTRVIGFQSPADFLASLQRAGH